MTDEQLKQLAQDMLAGKVFTDRMIPPDQEYRLSSIFMPLAFMDEEQRKRFVADAESGAVDMLYEYLDKAGPRAINGLPAFFSFRRLSRDEVEKVRDYAKRIEEAVAAV